MVRVGWKDGCWVKYLGIKALGGERSNGGRVRIRGMGVGWGGMGVGWGGWVVDGGWVLNGEIGGGLVFGGENGVGWRQLGLSDGDE